MARLHRRRVVPLLLVLATASVGASDWPQFRGPAGQGHSDERGVPLVWSESVGVAWKKAVPGLGWSSPVVAGGRVWLTTATDAEGVSLRVMAYDVINGATVVDREVRHLTRAERLKKPKSSLASPTPIVEGDRVYVHFGADGTAALTTAGEIVWTAKLEYESEHGNGGSPVLYGDLLIVSCDGFDEAFVVALDKNTGKQRWKVSRRAPWSQAYSTPLIIRVGERDQLVSVGAYRTTAYEPTTGNEIWRVSYDDGFSNVPRPVYGHGLVFLLTGFQEPELIAVRAGGTGDVTRSHVEWRTSRGAPLTSSPILVGDELYMVSDTGVASCLNAKTGTPCWQQRLGGNYSASPVFADGRIYFQNDEGVTTVIAPGTEFKKLATNTLDGVILASMAVSDGSMFIRTNTHLYRIR